MTTIALADLTDQHAANINRDRALRLFTAEVARMELDQIEYLIDRVQFRIANRQGSIGGLHQALAALLSERADRHAA